MLDKNNHFAPISLEEAGIDPQGVLNFLNACAAKDSELHSVMIIRDGRMAFSAFYAPYQPEDKRHVFSISKSWTSTAVGFAVSEGRLSVRDKVISFFPEECPAEISENLAAMEVRDLLRMGTGHDTDSTETVTGGIPRTAPLECPEKPTTWVERFLHYPVDHKPGSKFVYDSAASYMLSAIVQKVTGENLIDYLQPRLFAPLGIEHVWWEKSPEDICIGGWGIQVSTEDIAKLGWLYLQGGVFEGKQVLSPDWVKEATASHIDNAPSNTAIDWQQGYGYQIWRCQHDCFRFDGAFGQYMVAIPAKNAVVAITSLTMNMQTVLDAFWEHLLPAFQDGPLSKTTASQALMDRLPALTVPLPKGEGKTFSGAWSCEEENEQGVTGVQMETSPEGGVLTLEFQEDSPVKGPPIPFSTTDWRYAQFWEGDAGAAGSWQGNELTVQVQQRSTPLALHFILRPDTPELLARIGGEEFVFPLTPKAK